MTKGKGADWLNCRHMKKGKGADWLNCRHVIKGNYAPRCCNLSLEINGENISVQEWPFSDAGV
jgi:hypothetical protein